MINVVDTDLNDLSLIHEYFKKNTEENAEFLKISQDINTYTSTDLQKYNFNRSKIFNYLISDIFITKTLPIIFFKDNITNHKLKFLLTKETSKIKKNTDSLFKEFLQKQCLYSKIEHNLPVYTHLINLKKNQKYHLNLIETLNKTGKYKISITFPLFYSPMISYFQVFIQNKAPLKIYQSNTKRIKLDFEYIYFKNNKDTQLTIFNMGKELQFENNFSISVVPSTF